MSNEDIIRQLATLLEARKTADPENSYVASLYAAGLNRILEKVGEEAIELIIAAKEMDGEVSGREEVIREAADLWFHVLVMLSQLELDPNELLAELGRRFGTSGIEEKAARSK